MKYAFLVFIYFLVFSYCFSLQADSHGSTFNQYKGRVGITDIPLPGREHVEGPDYILLPPVAEQKAYFEGRFTDSLSREQARVHTAPSTHTVDSCNGNSTHVINANGGSLQTRESSTNNDDSRTIQLIPASTDGVITYGIVDPSPYWVLIKSVERVPYFSVIPMRLLPPTITHDSMNVHLLSDYKAPSAYGNFKFDFDNKRPVVQAGKLKLGAMPHQSPEPPNMHNYLYEQKKRDADVITQLFQTFGIIYSVYNLVVAFYHWCTPDESAWEALSPSRHWNKERFENAALAIIRDGYDGPSWGWNKEQALEHHQYALLAEYELYQFYGYINFLRTLPAYESYIITLYEGMCAEEKPYLSAWGQCKRYFWRPLWWDNLAGSCHNSFLENVRMQCVYIKNEQERSRKKEGLRAKQEQAALEISRQKQEAEFAEREQCIARENAQKEYIRKLKTLPEHRVEKQSVYEQPLSEKQKKVLQCLQENHEYLDGCLEKHNDTLSKDGVSEQEAERLRLRIDAIEQSKTSNFAFEVIDYPFSQHVADLLRESCIESHVFKGHDNAMLMQSIDSKQTTLDGSPIQHCIQQEIMTVLDQAADARCAHMQNSIVRGCTDIVGQVCFMASDYLQDGYIKVSTKAADFCWKMLDCLKDDPATSKYNIYECVRKPEYVGGDKILSDDYARTVQDLQQMKACWLESTKDIKSGLPGCGVAIINGVGAGIGGAAELVETGCHLAATGARGIKTGAFMAYSGAQAVGQGCNYAYEHSEEAYAHTLINLAKARKAGAEFLWEVKESFVPSDNATADRVGKRFVDTVMAIEAFLGPNEETDQKIQNFRNLSGPDGVYFITKNIVEAGIISGAGAAGKALKMEAVAMKRGAYGVRIICPAITALEKQAGVRLIGKEIAAGVIDVSAQPIPRYCLENASIRVANKAAEIILANEGAQLLAVVDKVAITKSPQFLTPLPGVLALKAAAQATLSTNTFGAIGAGTSVVTSDAKSTVVAGAVEKALAADVAHAVETKAVTSTAQRLLPAVIDKKANKEAANLFTRVSCRSEGCKAVHAIHSKKELRNALIHLRNNPLSIAYHELLPFDKPVIDIHGLMHMLGVEVKKGWDKKIKSLKKKLAGFHFNPNGRMDKYLSDIVVDEVTGVVKATINYGGISKEGKTFFPSSWTLEKLLNEMQVALLNPLQIRESGSRILFVGESSMGIRIEMVFEKTGKLVTAYPTLKKF